MHEMEAERSPRQRDEQARRQKVWKKVESQIRGQTQTENTINQRSLSSQVNQKPNAKTEKLSESIFSFKGVRR